MYCQHSIERYNGTAWEEVGQTLGFRFQQLMMMTMMMMMMTIIMCIK